MPCLTDWSAIPHFYLPTKFVLLDHIILPPRRVSVIVTLREDLILMLSSRAWPLATCHGIQVQTQWELTFPQVHIPEHHVFLFKSFFLLWYILPSPLWSSTNVSCPMAASGSRPPHSVPFPTLFSLTSDIFPSCRTEYFFALFPIISYQCLVWIRTLSTVFHQFKANFI